MFGKEYESNDRKFCLYITLSCKGKKRFRVWAEDLGKKNSKYADREIWVEEKRTIHFNFPISPKTLFLGIVNPDNVNDSEYDVVLMEAPLKTYNIDIDAQTQRFLNTSLLFSKVSGFEQGAPQGRVFNPYKDEFIIKYYDVIRDGATGNVLSTPARIGHQSGIIEVSKAKFDNYTIPMREIILLHEFSHKYKNPKIGLEISNEFGADVNGLYTYLGLGFSKIDAIVCFAKVFLKAQTPGNMARMAKINDYIQKFEAGQFAEPN